MVFFSKNISYRIRLQEAKMWNLRFPKILVKSIFEFLCSSLFYNIPNKNLMFQKIFKSCCLFESKPIRNIVLKINGAEKKSCSELIITPLTQIQYFLPMSNKTWVKYWVTIQKYVMLYSYSHSSSPPLLTPHCINELKMTSL